MNPHEIVSIEIIPIELPLIEPFIISYGAAANVESVLVRITDRAGNTGWGEGTPDETVTGENPATLRQDLTSIGAPGMLGFDTRRRDLAMSELERLLRDYLPRPDGALDGLEEISARSIGAPQLVVTIPGDIDSLVQADFESAMRYRMETREKIELAFDAGYFLSGAARAGAASRLLLEPAAMFEESGDEA